MQSGTTVFGNHIRVERKAGHNSSFHNPRRVRSNLVLSDAYKSPSRDQQSTPQHHGSPLRNMFTDSTSNATQAHDAPEPITPLRTTATGNAFSNCESPAVSSAPAPMGVPYWMAYGAPNYPSPGYANPSYTTSPYTSHIGAGPFAGSPQGAQGMVGPFAPYFPAHYPAAHWAAPYVGDSNAASMAYYSGFGQMTAPERRAGEDKPDSPTKPTASGPSDAPEHQGGSDAV